MKALLRFLLHTGVGREIVSALVRVIINLYKKKVLEKMEPYKRDNLQTAMDIADAELHADVESGRVKPTDLL